MEQESRAYEKKRRKIRQMRQQRRRTKRKLMLAMFSFAVLVFFLAGKMLYGIGQAFATESGIPKRTDDVDGFPAETRSNDAGALVLDDELSDEEKESYIQEHSWLYTEDLLELLEKNEETLDYVYYYPELFGAKQEIDLREEAEGETLPLLLQWDARWGYASGDGLIGYTGCAPTCLSMVALYLTGEADYTPFYIAEYAEKNGYYISGNGTDWSLINSGCLAFGIQSEEQPLDEDSMKAALDAGHPLVCSMRAGDFTDRGHFIVLTGYTDEGFTLNDPNSVKNSGRVWSYEELAWQIRKIWKFSAA